MSNIKAFEKVILDSVKEIDPNGRTTEVYEKIFKKLTIEQKHQLVKDLKNGKAKLFIMDPPLSGSKISFANNRAVAKKLFNYDFYKSIKYPARGTTPAFTTPNKHLTLDLTCRRQAQMLMEKISVSGGRQTVDNLTGAPSSTAKTSRLSFPELQLLKAHGMDSGLLELFTIRGGDVGGFRAYQDQLLNTGQASLDSIESSRTGVKSKTSSAAWLRASHLRNNLDE
jgi:hypothetical protein